MKKKGLTGAQQSYLDVFRLLAALFVMVGHSFGYCQLTIFKDQQYFAYLQNIGVVMFFLLSGFLTAHSLFNRNLDRSYTFSKFFKHKYTRIIIEYIPGLLFIALVDAVSIRLNGEGYIYYGAYNFYQFIGNAFFLHGTTISEILGRVLPRFQFIPFGSGRPLWTLALEWWFYLLFAFLYLTISNRDKIGWKQLILTAVLIFMPMIYLIGGRGGGLGFVFGLGVLAYYIYDQISRSAACCFFPISIALMIGYVAVVKEAYDIGTFILLFSIFCLGIKAFSGNDQNKGRNRLLSFLSRSTFMLYLIHYSIIDMISRYTLWQDNLAKFATGIGTSILFAMLLYYIFGEKKLLSRIFFIRR